MKEIVIFGECMIELVEQPTGHLIKNFAGDTFNTAVYLKRCSPDTTVHYLTAIGDDAQSDQLYRYMQNESLSTSLVQRAAVRHLGLYMVHTDDAGERSFTYWRKDSAATQTFNEMRSPIPAPDLFYFSGISIAILDDAQRQSLFDVIADLRRQGCKIAFDLNYRPALWNSVADAREWADRAYALSDIALSGVDDHAQLYQHTTVSQVVEHLSAFNIGESVIKNGASGVYLLTPSGSQSVPINPVENVVDTTAAGDAFNAGYLASRAKEHSAFDSALYGAKVAAVVIRHPGAIVAQETFNHCMPEY
ncbi:sugar kinase [Salinimonas chungwhensis]|uniref:sugar kinase n=1 Tax=Salinimonas chungwhensis TaxID=265425 RepID=UPI00035FB11B|nr:sugar kinase [Salinimonas chungwhensis]